MQHLKAHRDKLFVHAVRINDRDEVWCWGGNDGPDDGAENGLNWTILYALGAPEEILQLWRKGWEGHLKQ